MSPHDARSAILGRLRRAGRGSAEPARESVGGPRPRLAQEPVDLFLKKAAQTAATVGVVASLDRIPEETLAYLSRCGLPPRLLVAPHPSLDGLDWPEPMEVEHRRPESSDAAVLSVAFAAVAETGSIAMVSGDATPTSWNFLAETFVCVIAKNRVVGHLEDVFSMVRAELGSPPRALNLVTGPSRTADVEQTIQLGAHGPRRVHVILVEDTGAA